MVYHSKKDWWLVGLVWAGILLLLAAGIYNVLSANGNAQLGLILLFVCIFISAVVLFLTYPLYYEITASKLVIRCGLLVRTEIPLSLITEAHPTRNPQSAPAWSLDRLHINYRRDGEEGFVLISPEDKLRFIRELAGSETGLEVHGERMIRTS
jgi:hypothetical protein